MATRSQAGPWLALATLVASGAALWFWYPRPAPAPAPAAVATPAAAPAPVEPAGPPPVQHPIEAVPVLPTESAEPLPALADSDAAALSALGALMGGADPGAWLVPEFFLQRLVTTIDNLPRATLSRQVYAAREMPGTLALAEADGRLWLDPANASRYEAAVVLFEAVDSRALVSAYVRFYPLLQQAYRELGVPDRTFNDRLVEVIDHLLAAPEVSGPIELRRIEGRPRLAFADPRRESASVGHKAMWRLSPEQAVRVKAKLAELRALLAGQRPAG